MIRINDDWAIEVEDLCYTLKRDLHRTTTRKDKDGETVVVQAYAIKGYFSTFDKALERIGTEIIKDGLKDREMQLTEAIEVVRECRDCWQELVKTVKHAEVME